MKTTMEKISIHCTTTMGEDIGNELHNRKTVVIPQPQYSQEVLDQHTADTAKRTVRHERLQTARKKKVETLKGIVKKGDAAAADAEIELAELENTIEEDDEKASRPLPIELEGDEKIKHYNAWRTCRERETQLQKHRGQAFSMIRGQCMQVLLDKMKHDKDWDKVSQSYDPLLLLNLIERNILSQTEDQYPYATVYEQERALYSYQQNKQTNQQYYERLNTINEVGKAIGVTRQHEVLLEHSSYELKNKKKFTELDATEQAGNQCYNRGTVFGLRDAEAERPAAQ